MAHRLPLRRVQALTLFICMLGLLTAAPVRARPLVLPLEERARVIDQILAERMRTVLPALMRRTGVDLWVIISREYNEDPVLKTMLPATWLSARRRTILLIHDPGEGQPLETLAVARYGVGDTFTKAWDREQHGEQWARLAELIEERDPRPMACRRRSIGC